MKNSIQKQGKKMVKAVKKLAKDVEMHEDAEKGMYKKMNAKKKDRKGRNTCGK